MGFRVVEGGISPVLYNEGAISGQHLGYSLHQLAPCGLACLSKALRSDIDVVGGPKVD